MANKKRTLLNKNTEKWNMSLSWSSLCFQKMFPLIFTQKRLTLRKFYKPFQAFFVSFPSIAADFRLLATIV